MKRFIVTKCVDAFVHYEVEVKAKTAEQAKQLAIHYNDILAWEKTGVTEYDHADFDNIPPESID